jgi:hypothetical protein
MTARELTDWIAFERVFGPITVHERLDVLLARVAYAVVAAAGGKARPEDFMPRWDQAPRAGTVQRGFEQLIAMAKANDAHH